MKESIKEKLTGKSAYIILILLIATILTLSIVSIVSAVNKKDSAPITDGVIDNTPPANNEVPSDDNTENTTPSDTPTNTPDTDKDDSLVDSTDKTVFSLPCTGSVQKDYSEDVLVFSQTMNDHRIHLGLDISGKLGDPVKAVADGIIEKIFSDPFMGKTIVINHGNGVHSYYMNLSATIPEEITEGVTVKNGTVIGAIGETAMSECADEPHLHFEIRLDGNKVNPRNYITIPSFSENEDTAENDS